MTALHQNLDHLPDTARGCAIAIGNFDGMHKGHCALIARTQASAKGLDAPLGVLTFTPHPRRFFQPQAEPFLITKMPMKQRLMSDAGVDHLFALNFARDIAEMTAEEFIERVLIEKLQTRHVTVGRDFAFGKDRGGTAALLSQYSQHFTLDAVDRFADNSGAIFSSSLVRGFLRTGDFDAAEKALGWRWQIENPIVRGDQRGRLLGFPTANQEMNGYVRPPFGIYAVKAMIEGENIWRNGVANIGIRPMYPSEVPLCETFIFDFSDEIYGKMLRIMPIKKLRAEMRFDGEKALIVQMKEDCIQALLVLESRQTSKKAL